MHSDQPANEDTLNRRPFATRLAKVIASQTDPAPLVVAVNGAWGDGKTTVLGFLAETLKSGGVPVVHFNPWRFGSEDEMMKGFFVEISEGLDSQLLKKGEKLAALAKRKLGWVGAGVKKATKVLPYSETADVGIELVEAGALRWLFPAIEELRSRVREKLTQHKKRVVVLVDDPDRLDVEELFSLFRLIKLTADFDYITFVLAMDCDAAARTVGRRFGGDEQGRRFLEKIVQVPVRLPAVPRMRLKGFTIDFLNHVLKDLESDFGPKESQRFVELFDLCLMPEIRTPRAAKQYANVIRFALGLLPGEVNSVDVMLLEGIRLFFPDIFVRMQETLMETDVDKWHFKERGERVQALLARIVPADHRASGILHQFFTALFPLSLGPYDPSDDSYRELMVGQRVACDEYFVRYLASAVPTNDVPDSEMALLLVLCDEGKDAGVRDFVRNRLELNTTMIFIKKLRLLESGMTDSQRSCLSIAVASCSGLLNFSDVGWQFETPFGKTAMFSAVCIKNLRDGTAREGLAKEILQAASSIVWAIEYFRWLPHKEEADPNKPDPDTIKLFEEPVSARLGVVLTERVLLELESLQSLPSLHVLHQMVGHSAWHSDAVQEARLKAWVRGRLERDIAFLEDLCATCMTWSYGNEGRSLEWPGDDIVLRSIARKVDTDWLISTFDPVPPAEREGRFYEISAEEAAYRVIKLLKRNQELSAVLNEDLGGVLDEIDPEGIPP